MVYESQCSTCQYRCKHLSNFFFVSCFRKVANTARVKFILNQYNSSKVNPHFRERKQDFFLKKTYYDYSYSRSNAKTSLNSCKSWNQSLIFHICKLIFFFIPCSNTVKCMRGIATYKFPIKNTTFIIVTEKKCNDTFSILILYS